MNPKNTRAAALSTSVTSGAQANGIAINTVTGVLTNGQEYISHSPVTFSISPASNATFVNGGTQLSVNTNTLGEASVDLVDNTAETVTVTLYASDYSATARASTTFTADGNSNLFPPFIDQVLNQTVELDLLKLPVTVSAEGNFLAGQTLVLRLYGYDASGAVVPDTTYSHMFPKDTKRVAFIVDIEVLRQYGGTDVNPHDSGQLGIIYTLNGQQSRASSYNVYGPGGMNAHNYTLTGLVVDGSVPADGESGCLVYWQVQENGASVSGLKANLSVSGSAGFELVSRGRAESGEVTLPALVSYTDTRAERVMAEAVLVGYPSVSASEQLVFTAVHTYQIHAKIEQNNAAANGSAVNQVTWSVTDENNVPVNNVAATASVSGQAKIIGENAVTLPATLSYTDTAVEAVTAGMALTESGASESVSLTFSENQVLTVYGEVKKNNAQADGTSANVVSWSVKDQNGNPVNNKSGTVSVTNSANASPTTLTLPGDVKYTSLREGNASTTLTLASGEKATVDLAFDYYGGECEDIIISAKVTNNNAAADGKAQNIIEWSATDVNGKPVSVRAQISGNNQVSPQLQQVTFPATTAFTDTKAESVLITAKLVDCDNEHSVGLVFKNTQTCHDVNFSDFFGMADLCRQINYNFISGHRYHMTLTSGCHSFHFCDPGYHYVASAGGCLNGGASINWERVNNEIYLTSPVNGNLSGTTHNAYLWANGSCTVSVCITDLGNA